jgi:hypothetical protein
MQKTAQFTSRSDTNRRAAKSEAADAWYMETMGPAEKAGGEKSLVRLSLLRSLSSPPTKVEERMPTERAEPVSPTAERDYRVWPYPVKRSSPPPTLKNAPPGAAASPPEEAPNASRSRIPRKDGEQVSDRGRKRRPRPQSPVHERTGQMTRRCPVARWRISPRKPRF